MHLLFSTYRFFRMKASSFFDRRIQREDAVAIQEGIVSSSVVRMVVVTWIVWVIQFSRGLPSRDCFMRPLHGSVHRNVNASTETLTWFFTVCCSSVMRVSTNDNMKQRGDHSTEYTRHRSERVFTSSMHEWALKTPFCYTPCAKSWLEQNKKAH